MRLIKLTRGYFAEVSDEDYEYLNQWTWTAKSQRDRIYATRQEFTGERYKNGDRKYTLVSMHRVVLNVLNPEILVDHKDRNGLNNQRNNIRIATTSENCKNSRSRKNSTSKYLGVSKKSVKNNKNEITRYIFTSQIQLKNKKVHLGSFDYTPEGEVLAAKAYDSAAKMFHKEFANLNFKD